VYGRVKFGSALARLNVSVAYAFDGSRNYTSEVEITGPHSSSVYWFAANHHHSHPIESECGGGVLTAVVEVSVTNTNRTESGYGDEVMSLLKNVDVVKCKK
jgi:hypothetical protein